MFDTKSTDIFGCLKETIDVDPKDTAISEEDHSGLIETMYLSSIPEMREKIIEGLRTPIEECLTEDEVDL